MMKKIVYQGQEYNITSFINQHPGGAAIINQYLTLKIDITDVFKSLHSKKAQHKLLALQKIVKVDRLKSDRTYTKIQERIRRFYSPSYFKQITMTLLIYTIFISCLFFATNPLMIIAAIALSQILGAWLCHSQLHLRNIYLNRLAKFTGAIIMGISANWWKQKHLKHHLFTNNDKLDQDIQHNYPVFLYPFMLIKWRLTSSFSAFRHLQLFQTICISAHYFAIVKLKILFPFIIGVLFGSFYLAIISQGNHEREKRYRGDQINDFLTQQTESTRNYDVSKWLWSWALGGFNYHVQHHLFPQVPFYKLYKAHRIVLEDFQIYKKSIETGNIII